MTSSILTQSTVKWHESWIVRAAVISSLILSLGFAGSAYFVLSSIEGVSALAHDPEVEAVLSQHLETLRSLHKSEQDLLTAKLTPFYLHWHLRHRTDEPDAEEIKGWLKVLQGDPSLQALLGHPENLNWLPRAASQDKALHRPLPGAVQWLTRTHLQVGTQVIGFPKGQAFDTFQAALELKQRYQLLGEKLNEKIKPSLIRATSVVLVLTFLSLLSMLLLHARRFRSRINEVTAGFANWSEVDSGFRFDDSYSGELKLITTQFNALASEVAANRSRSLYLEKMASWQIIARKLAHEIKNPLTPIQMVISQLPRRYKGNDEGFASLLSNAQQIINDEITSLRRMVDHFSSFARLPQPHFTKIDLVKTCNHALMLQKNVDSLHHYCFISTELSCMWMVDDGLIRQVLLNLLKNAAEACTGRAAQIEILLEFMPGISRQDDVVILQVKDNGPGITAELQQRIFEAYVTTKHTGPSPGMGLGLAICQKIILDHGGSLLVRSRPDGGETVFTVRLPQRRREAT